jgi:periplasmic divalent cation tolerance protein
MRRARELHPYEVPEIVVLPVCAAYRRYADWVAREARPAGRGP